jgi:DNA-binding response OmpR family regulator
MACILIIDDDRDIRHPLRLALENAGHDVRPIPLPRIRATCKSRDDFRLEVSRQQYQPVGLSTGRSGGTISAVVHFPQG